MEATPQAKTAEEILVLTLKEARAAGKSMTFKFFSQEDEQAYVSIPQATWDWIHPALPTLETSPAPATRDTSFSDTATRKKEKEKEKKNEKRSKANEWMDMQALYCAHWVRWTEILRASRSRQP